MSEAAALLSINNNIATVTLNRPEKKNALNMAIFKQLKSHIKTLKKDLSLRAIIITGEGTDFCSGLDIKSVMSSSTAAVKLLAKFWPSRVNNAQIVSRGWREIPVPVICAINGLCWGGGMQIALGADFRIAHPDSSLAIMETKWGLCPDMAGTLGLREIMPLDKAMLMTMNSQPISAQQALADHLITEISENPLERAMSIAEQLAEKSPDAIAAVKNICHKAWHKNDSQILALETISQLKIIFGKNQK